MDGWFRSLLVLVLCTGFLVGHEVAADQRRVHDIVHVPAGDGSAPALPDRLSDGSQRPPDVVLILTDDQRPDTVARMRTVRDELRDKGVRCPLRLPLGRGGA